MIPNIPHSAFTIKCDRTSDQLKSKVIILNGNSRAEVVALWDTGATGTCISTDVVKKLSLVASGKKNICTPSGTTEVNTYLVDIILPNNVNIPNVEVCDSQIGEQHLGALIGMDIINLGDFAVSNVNGNTLFSFRTPSVQKIDFVSQINTQKIIGTHGKGKRKKKVKT